MVFELAGGLPIAPQVTAAPPPSAGLDWSHEPIEFEPPPREEFDIIAARPLFSPSRRPFVATQVPEAAPATPETLPPLELIGVLLTDEQRNAFIRPLDGSGPSWVREGETMAGWRIATIERSRIHLRAGDRVEVLELRADTTIPAQERAKRRRAREDERHRVQSGRAAQSDQAKATAGEDGAKAGSSD